MLDSFPLHVVTRVPQNTKVQLQSTQYRLLSKGDNGNLIKILFFLLLGSGIISLCLPSYTGTSSYGRVLTTSTALLHDRVTAKV